MVSEHEGLIRLVCFAAVLVLMAAWELAAPRRTLLVRKGRRWGSNLVLVVVNTLAVRLLLPLTAVALADRAGDRGWGVLNLVDWPAPLEFALGFVALDFAIYLQHVMFHAVPVFWRLHRVHHADLDFDVTTGLRFHTIEILLSMLIKFGVILMLGPSAWCVVLFEIVLNATSMFNHSNVRMPAPIDRLLRWLVVTPDMHRVHHSILRRETDSNFGFNLPWWDRLCGTYRAQPEAGHEGMTIGLSELRDERQTTPLYRILWMPFDRSDRPTGTFAAEESDADPQSTGSAAGPFPNAGNAVAAVEKAGRPPYHPPHPTADRTPSSPPVAVANDNAQGHVRQREEVDRGA